MIRALARVALLALLALPASGCALMLLSGGHEGGTGLLSGAAHDANPDSTTRTKAPPPDVGWKTPPVVVIEPTEPGPAPGLGDDARAVVPAPGPRPHVNKKTHPFYVGLVGGVGALGGREYDGLSTFGLTAGGFPEPRIRVDGAVTFEVLAFKEEAYLHHAFVDPGEFNLDVTARFYVTPPNTFMGLYPLAGLGTGTLLWDYGQPVTVTEDGATKTLTDDMINYFSFYGGVGMSLVQTRWVHVGGNLAGGVRFYGWHTDSGLRNDVLKPTGYLRFLVELCFGAGKV